MGHGEQYTPSARRAFTLIELSIVLVIVGLLVGGVLAGKSLIKAAELRSVSSDFQKYYTAILTFRNKYSALPGDMATATNFWGVAGGDGTGIDVACRDTVSTNAQTCNGNGNGDIGDFFYEGLRLWQHLANAGLVEGTYTGTYNLATGFLPSYITAGLNIPVGRIGNSSYLVGPFSSGPGGVQFGPAGAPGVRFSGLHIDLVRPPTTSTGGPTAVPFTGVLKHEDAWNIDSKMDDGIANTGKVRSDFIKVTGAQAAITDMTCQAYDPTNTTNTCALAYIFGK